MHSFVIVAAKPGRTIAPDVVENLRQPDDEGLPFVPDQHLHWQDDTGSIHFAGWQAFTDTLGIGSHWQVDEQGLVAFSGHPWPRATSWTRGSSWASQLRQIWRSSPILTDDERFGGVYSALSVDRAGRGTIITDPLSLAILYHSENDDATVISNNARLAASTANPGGPTRDPMGAAWLVHLGYMLGAHTTYSQTQAVPAGSLVELDPRFGCRIADRTGSPWSAPGQTDLPAEAWMDLVHADLRASVRSVAELPTDELMADLTGGRDSRLVLALLMELGYQDRFKFRTTGDDHTSDSQAGELIAARLGLRHEPLRPQPMDSTDFVNRLRTHVFQTSGMLNPWDFKGALRVSRTPRVSGLLGELLRGSRHLQLGTTETNEELWEGFRRSLQLHRPSLLRPEVRKELDGELRAHLLDPMHTGGTSPQDRLDSFYIRQRVRRWVGAQEELGEACRILPLYSMVGVQAAFALGADVRKRELIAFEVMRRADAELTKLPLADAGWHADLLSDLPDGRAYGAKPIKTRPGGARPVQWQRTRIDDNIEVVRDHLLDERSNPIFDIMDRSAVEAVLVGESDKTSRSYNQLFGALSASIFLGGDELAARYGHSSYEAAHAKERPPTRQTSPVAMPNVTEPMVVQPSPPQSPADPSDRPTKPEGHGGAAPPSGTRQLARRLLLTTARRLRDLARRIPS